MSSIRPNSTGDMDKLYPIVELEQRQGIDQVSKKALDWRKGNFENFKKIHQIRQHPAVTPKMWAKITEYIVVILFHQSYPACLSGMFEPDLEQLTFPWPFFGDDAVKIAAIVQEILHPGKTADRKKLSRMAKNFRKEVDLIQKLSDTGKLAEEDWQELEKLQKNKLEEINDV